MSSMEHPTASEVLGTVPKELLVGGHWVPAEAGGTFGVEDPSTGEVLTEVADAGRSDALCALEAACRAQPSWGASAPRERAELLRRAYEEMEDRRDQLATLVTLEMGKPVGEARAEVDYAAGFLRWFAGEAERVQGDYRVAPDGRRRIVVTRQPVGPCLLITPWNFPIAMGARKIAPALAAGCTVVVKPAEQTPLSTLAMADILERAGSPPGVVNVVTTSRPAGVAEPLLADGRVRKLSFTGSTDVGRHLIAEGAPQVLRMSMELGGNAPFLVFADADLDGAVEGAMVAKMRNGGEACTAANRFYVEQPVAAEFSRRLGERMGALRVGRGLDAGVEVGPLIDAPAVQKVGALVSDARARGAEVLVGGGARGGAGYFFEPTVLAGVPDDASLLSTEIFGPVAPVAAFSSESEAVALANGTCYGLVSFVYTRDLGRAFRVAEALETGMVGLNQGVVSDPAAPFGGVKQSGLGREGGREGIEEYLAVKYMSLAP